MQASTFRIAWRNLWRNRRRTLLAVLAITVGQWALLATQGLMRGYGDNIQRAITGPMIGHVQLHAPDYRDERALDLVIRDVPGKLQRIREVPAVRNAAARIYASVLAAPERDAYVATLVGIDVASESEPFGLLSGNREPLQPEHVMLGYRLAERSGAEPGDTIALIGQAADGHLANDLFTVQSVIKGPVDRVNQSGVVMALSDARRFLVMPDEAHEIVVRVKQLDAVGSVLTELQRMSVLSHLEILPWREIVPELVMIVDMVDYVGWFVLGLVLVAALAGIINTLMMATYERMHEFGMLLALGCRPLRIVRLIMVEAVLLGLLGVGTGTALGLGFIGITRRTGIDMASWGGDSVEQFAYAGMNLPLDIVPRLEPADPFIGLVAIVLVSLLAAAWPASLAGRLDPMEAMRS